VGVPSGVTDGLSSAEFLEAGAFFPPARARISVQLKPCFMRFKPKDAHGKEKICVCVCVSGCVERRLGKKTHSDCQISFSQLLVGP